MYFGAADPATTLAYRNYFSGVPYGTNDFVWGLFQPLRSWLISVGPLGREGKMQVQGSAAT
jgi:hypothetical protein